MTYWSINVNSWVRGQRGQKQKHEGLRTLVPSLKNWLIRCWTMGWGWRADFSLARTLKKMQSYGAGGKASQYQFCFQSQLWRRAALKHHQAEVDKTQQSVQIHVSWYRSIQIRRVILSYGHQRGKQSAPQYTTRGWNADKMPVKIYKKVV